MSRRPVTHKLQNWGGRKRDLWDAVAEGVFLWCKFSTKAGKTCRRSPRIKQCPRSIPWLDGDFKGGSLLRDSQAKGELGAVSMESHRRDMMRWRCRPDNEETIQSDKHYIYGVLLLSGTAEMVGWNGAGHCLHNHALKVCLTALLPLCIT